MFRFILVALLFCSIAIAEEGVIETIIAPATEESPRNSEGDIVVLKDGSLLAAWSDFYGGNRDDSAGRISAKKSTDGGRTWSERWTLVENTGAENVMSASFLRPRSGGLLLFYLEKNSKEDLDVIVRRSDDEGETWSDPVLVTADAGYWVMNNARVVQLASGRIVCPTAYTEKVWVPESVFRTVCFFSDDEGSTWRRGAGGATAPKRGAMEPGLVERKDGSLLQYIRTQTGMQWFATSEDGSDTWSRSAPWTVVSPESPATIAEMPDGRCLVIHNPTVDLEAGHSGKRTPLVAATSSDEGNTWSPPKAIESDPELTYAYTSITFHEGRALLSYYVSDAQRRISWKFKSLPLEWFPEAPAPTRFDPDDLTVFRKDDGTLGTVANADDWARRRADIVKGFEAVAGPFPDKGRAVPAFEILEETDRGNYLLQKIRYQGEAGSETPAFLCLPKAAKETAAPAVLCLHPTDDQVGNGVVVGLGGKPNRQYASELAERGYVTISPAYPHLADYAPNLEALGYASGTMKAVWDNVRALDLLESLPFVDSSKGFGAIGHSLGGHNAIYTAVFDERIAAVATSCGFDSYRDYYGGEERVWFFGKGWCQIRYLPRMSDYRGRLDEIPFDFPELLGALAPRPVFVNAPIGDSNFRWDSVDRCAASARPIYELLGNADGIRVEHPDCDHDFPREMREAAYALFDETLKRNDPER